MILKKFFDRNKIFNIDVFYYTSNIKKSLDLGKQQIRKSDGKEETITKPELTNRAMVDEEQEVSEES